MERPTIQLGEPASVGAVGALRRLEAFKRLGDFCGDRVLDIGCGNGMYTQHMLAYYARVAAADVEPQRVDQFRARISAHEAQRLDIRQISTALPWPDSYFDAVTAIEVLEHVADLPTLLREVRRVLKPGGQFFITVPNRLFPLETHGVVVASKWMPGKRVPFITWIPPLHGLIAEARIYTATSLSRLLVHSSFIPGPTDWIMPPFDHWRFGQRWIKPITDRLERSPLRRFGVSIVMVAYR